jgi:hypothetical protein
MLMTKTCVSSQVKLGARQDGKGKVNKGMLILNYVINQTMVLGFIINARRSHIQLPSRLTRHVFISNSPLSAKIVTAAHLDHWYHLVSALQRDLSASGTAARSYHDPRDLLQAQKLPI